MNIGVISFERLEGWQTNKIDKYRTVGVGYVDKKDIVLKCCERKLNKIEN